MLHSSQIARRLVGREPELAKFRQFVSSRCNTCRGGSLYICGHPGTGKTALVLDQLKQILPDPVRSSSCSFLDDSPFLPKQKMGSESFISSVTFLNCMTLCSLPVRKFCAKLQHEVEASCNRASVFEPADGGDSDLAPVDIQSSEEAALVALESFLLSLPGMTCAVLGVVSLLNATSLTSQGTCVG